MTKPSRPQPSGIHHIAIMASDIKKHIAFFSEVMNFPLVACLTCTVSPAACMLSCG